MQQILIKPIITEKSIKDANNGIFTFIVALSSNKNSIRQAIEDQFKVHVTGVSTTVLKGRGKRTGPKRVEAVDAPVKKASVALRKGEKIDLFEIGA